MAPPSATVRRNASEAVSSEHISLFPALAQESFQGPLQSLLGKGAKLCILLHIIIG